MTLQELDGEGMNMMKFPKNNNKNVFKKEYTQKPSKKNGYA